ncbi:MAG: hypothetical protein A4S09_10545 [Proteobacteria bacterium SG_bin7]|nr:MAG: hypothetical protein A4S09_10545 [Proteobacteria bacterium SG_bin7]
MLSFRQISHFSIAGFTVVFVSHLDPCLGMSEVVGFKDYSSAQIAKLKKEADSGNQALKARKLLGIYYFQKKKFLEAIEILVPVQDGLDKQGIQLLSKSYHNQKNYLNEIRVLEQWLSRNQKDYTGIKDLGDAYLAMGNRIDAAKTYQLAIQVNKKYEPAYEALIRVNDDEGNSAENLSLIQDMLKIFGGKKLYFHRLCEYYYTDGFLKEARGYCQKAVNSDPKYPDSHVILGLTYRDEQNPLRYQKVLTTAAKQFPNSELAQYMAGQMSEDLKDIVSALKFYLQATKADSDSVRSWLRLASVGIAVKNYEQSLKAFMKACDLDRSKALEPFRTAVSTLRSQGVNQWYKQYEESVQKCKYLTTIVRSSKVKDFTIKPTAEEKPNEKGDDTSGMSKGTSALPQGLKPLPTSGSSPDGTVTPTESND